MSARFVPSLQEILYRLVGAATEQSLSTTASSKPGRFPVVVRPETRAFLEAQADYLGGSIAGVAGAILDGVAMATQGREGAPSMLRGVSERFNLLLREHGLSIPASVEALSDLGFTLADFTSADALQLKLSSPVLRQVADRFHINYDWLVGKSNSVSDTSANPPQWYKATNDAADKILEAMHECPHVELLLLIKEGTNLGILDDSRGFKALPHFLPILARLFTLPGGEGFTTYEIWEEGRWSYRGCRDHIKLVVHFTLQIGIRVSGKSVSPQDYDRLVDGRTLPATILQPNRSVMSWHPDDYVRPESPVAKDPREWNEIKECYPMAFEYFDKLLRA